MLALHMFVIFSVDEAETKIQVCSYIVVIIGKNAIIIALIDRVNMLKYPLLSLPY